MKWGKVRPSYIKSSQRHKALMTDTGTEQTKFYRAREVAQQLGISKQTLLRYEAKGLFPKASRNKLNRWREYTSSDIQELRKRMGR